MSISTDHADGPRTQLAKLGSATKPLIGAFILAAVVIVGVVFMLAGDESNGDAVTAELEAADPVTTSTPIADDGDLEVGVPGEDDALLAGLPRESHDVYLSRDPFEPVVEELEDTETVDGSGSDDGGEGDGGTDDGDASTEPGREVEQPDDPRFEDGCTGTGEVVCGGRVVTLVGVLPDRADPTAIIRVDVAVHEVSPGDEFAEHFTLRSIDDACVSLAYGDEAFELCEGEHLMK